MRMIENKNLKKKQELKNLSSKNWKYSEFKNYSKKKNERKFTFDGFAHWFNCNSISRYQSTSSTRQQHTIQIFKVSAHIFFQLLFNFQRYCSLSTNDIHVIIRMNEHSSGFTLQFVACCFTCLKGRFTFVFWLILMFGNKKQKRKWKNIQQLCHRKTSLHSFWLPEQFLASQALQEASFHFLSQKQELLHDFLKNVWSHLDSTRNFGWILRKERRIEENNEPFFFCSSVSWEIEKSAPRAFEIWRDF